MPAPRRRLRIWPGSEQVGAKFGVVLVNRGGATVEVVTFRSEQAYQDGRHPDEVHFETDPRKDVQRRDFTINALLLDPFTGEVIDYVNGRADLAAGVIRAIGDPAARFEEDHLRMLRAVRFAARFGFTIEPATMAAIRRCHAEIRRISAERVRDELTRILTEGGARRGFELLDETGLLVDILPEVAAMKGVQQPPRISSRRRRVDPHAPHAGRAGASFVTLALGCCCTMSASRRRSVLQTASASTGTWRRA